MKLNLRNMWSRMPLTRADVQMLHGMMRQMVRWKERGKVDLIHLACGALTLAAPALGSR